MAEAIAAISLVANIARFIDYVSKVARRLNELHTRINEVPKIDIRNELPLLLDTLEKTKEQAELGRIAAGT